MDSKTLGTAAQAAAAAFKMFEGSDSKKRKRSRGPSGKATLRHSGTSFKRRFLARTMMVPNQKDVTIHLNGFYSLVAASGPNQYFDIIYNSMHEPMNTGAAVTAVASAVNSTPTVATHGYYGLAQWLGAARFYDSYRVTRATLKVTVNPNHDYDGGEIIIIPIKNYQGVSDTGLTTQRAAKDTGWASSCSFTRGKVCTLTKTSTVASLYGCSPNVVASNENFQARYGTNPVNYAVFRVFIAKGDGTAWSGNVPFSLELIVTGTLFNSDQGNVGSSVV